MKIKAISILSLAVTLLIGCSNPEKESLKVVDNFLTQFNDEIEGNGDTTKIDKKLFELIKTYGGFLSKDGWSLNFNQKNDSTILIESVGKTHNSFGQPIEIKQKFLLKNTTGQWIIYDTYNLLPLFLNMDIVDRDWDFFWDIEKNEILTELQDSLKLEIIRNGYKNSYSDAVKGELRLVNNSQYDIRNVSILIEHFDKDGRSVNTDDEYIPDIIRANGYREFDWYTSDCDKCSKQEFKIKFQREF